MPRDLDSYRRQGRRDFRAFDKNPRNNPFKKPDIAAAWQEGFDAAAAAHEKHVAAQKVVRWVPGYRRDGDPTEYYLRGDGPKVLVRQRDKAWEMTCISFGVESKRLNAERIEDALPEALQRLREITTDRLAETDRVLALPSIPLAQK